MSDASVTAGHDGRAVANELLLMARETGRELTVMQLLKILFFAHGLNLALHGRPLLQDRAQAWQYGPVFPRVYAVFSKAGRLPIRNLAADKKTGLPFVTSLAPEERALLRSALLRLGDVHAFKLSELSHKPGGPWDVTIKKEGVYKEIPNDLIRRDFLQHVRPPAAAVG